MAAIGGSAGYLYVFHSYMQADGFYPLLVIISITAILAYSRLLLKAHKPSQLILGILVGFLTSLSTLLIL